MIGKATRRAFEKGVEDLAGAGAGLRDLVAAIAADGSDLLDRYRDVGDVDARKQEVDLGADTAAEQSVRALVRRDGDGRVEAFEVWRAALGCGDDLLSTACVNAFSAAQNRDVEGTLWIALLLSRIAFVSPEASRAVGSALTDGWLAGKSSRRLREVEWPEILASEPLEARRLLGVPDWFAPPSCESAALEVLRERRSAPAGLWDAFWTAAGQPVDPATITPLVASLGGAFDDRLKQACARDVLSYPGQCEVADAAWWPRLDIDSLAACKPGTLGHAYYHLIVDNGFDPEVLDPELVSGFHPVLDASNRRILQTHEVWHLVAGYSTSPLHEVAISGFQLAQFGHNYSAMFLATAVSLLAFHLPMFLDPILQVTFEGWRHGRETRPLMEIDWFSLWNEEIETLRERFAIAPFTSAVADAAAAA